MEISVIIPVYNCLPFIERCIDCVLNQEFVNDIIVVDDGSTDGSYDWLLQKAKTDPKIKLFTHHDRQNMGRSATRNLALKNATNEWVAFCDADDYFLPNRFINSPREINEAIDGLYGRIKTEYLSDELKKSFPEEVTEINAFVSPQYLLNFLILNDNQRFSLNALLVRKGLIIKVGGFDESLDTGEDTDLIWRMADVGILKKEKQKRFVAIRNIHGQNSFSDQKLMAANKFRFYKKWLNYKSTNISSKARNRLLKKVLFYMPAARRFDNQPLTANLIRGMYYLRYKFGIKR